MRGILLIAGISGFLAVLLGAFGAHGLEATLGPDRLAVYQTAVDYQFRHTLALLALGLIWGPAPAPWSLYVAAIGWILGLVLFSGSLYALVLTDIGWLGAITPLGGLAFLIGWLAFVVGAWQRTAGRGTAG
jgi:uncharacterized membrane protein YgdD (TMEM256/DUF423 family)